MIIVRRFLLLAALTGACASVRTPPPASLPLRQVVLYSNGLGYFQRAGRLRSGRLSMQLRPTEIDDVLKTLAVQASNGTSPAGSAASTKRLDEAGQTELDLTVPGDRDVTVSYAAPSPPWQTVYKLMLDGDGAGSLETWATVTNASDEDWRGVRLTLATGAPFSNRVDLHSPECRPQPNATGDPAGAGLAPAVAPERTGPDRDHDRIPDAVDACPDDPETYNGYEDEDGCPDKGKVLLYRGRSFEILDRLYFAPTELRVAPLHGPLLDAIAQALKANPQIKLIEVRGYASSDETQPLWVAVERAASVRQALLARGVARERLRIRSYGVASPVCTGAGETCHRQNRRVEFAILDPPPHDRATELALMRANARAPAPPLAPHPEGDVGTPGYEISAPVTVPHRSSATVAIQSARVRATEVGFFRPDPSVAGSNAHLYRAVRFEAPAGGPLRGGPLAIYARGTYVGDAIVGPMQPDEVSLLPFALDASSKITVTQEASSVPGRLIKIAHGNFTVEDRDVLRTHYEVVVKSPRSGPVYLRHQRLQGYEHAPLPPGTEPGEGADIVPVSPGRDGRAQLTIEESRTMQREVAWAAESEFDLEPYILETDALPVELTHRLRRLEELRASAARSEREQDSLGRQADDTTRRFNELRESQEALEKNPGAAPLRKQLTDELAEATRTYDGLLRKTAALVAQRERDRAEARSLLNDLAYELPIH